MEKEQKQMLILGVVVLGLIVSIVLLWQSVDKTNQAYGGSYENCVEQGHEAAMCKRVFEW